MPTKKTTTTPIKVLLPNGQSLQSTHDAILPFPNLPQMAVQAHIFPGLSGHALLSIGTLCDAGCTAKFSATTVTIEHKGKVVLTGIRQPPEPKKRAKEPKKRAIRATAKRKGIVKELVS